MKRITGIGMLSIILMTACGPAQVPLNTPVPSTATAAPGPTGTPGPGTIGGGGNGATATATAEPTATVPHTATVPAPTATATVLPTASATSTATATPQPTATATPLPPGPTPTSQVAGQSLQITEPNDQATLSTRNITIRGTSAPGARIRLNLAGQPDPEFFADAQGRWAYPVTLRQGRNDFDFFLQDYTYIRARLTVTFALPTSPEPTATPSSTTFRATSATDAPDANPGNGVCAAASGQCTLRAAIMETNALSRPVLIVLSPLDYLLNSQLEISGVMTLSGTRAGGRGPVIDGQDRTRIVHVLQGGNAHIDGVILRNGLVSDSLGAALGGGTILNYGRLTISNATIADGYSAVGSGGITNHGTLMVTDTTLSGNGAQYSGGCGLRNAPGATARLERILITNNTCTHAGKGGGVMNHGVMTIIDSTMRDNRAVTSANIFNAGALTLRGSTFVGPTGDGEPSGGIQNDPDGTINDQGGNTFTPS